MNIEGNKKSPRKKKWEWKLSSDHILATNNYDFGICNIFKKNNLMKVISTFNDVQQRRSILDNFFDLIWF
jgi:hypothetical protein